MMSVQEAKRSRTLTPFFSKARIIPNTPFSCGLSHIKKLEHRHGMVDEHRSVTCMNDSLLFSFLAATFSL
jgi:hypothetical protein